MKVLVLDDDPEIARVVSRVVEYLGHTPFSETDPVIALVTHQDRMDAAVIDFSMPRMNGIDVCRVLALQSPQTLRIVLTAVPEIEEIREAVQTGLIQVLIAKPPSISELEEALSRVDSTFIGKA